MKAFINQLGRPYRQKGIPMPNEKYNYKKYFTCIYCEEKYDLWRHHIVDSPICDEL